MGDRFSCMSKKKLCFEQLESNVYSFQEIYRTKVPGGWLVVIKGTSGEGVGLTFYPDPNYEWDGSSID